MTKGSDTSFSTKYCLLHRSATLFIMKTSHKSDELKKNKKGGVFKSGTYETNIPCSTFSHYLYTIVPSK